jgi:hypothetical protein
LTTAFCIGSKAYRYVEGDIFHFGHLDSVKEGGWLKDTYVFVHDELHKVEKESSKYGGWSRM